MTSETPKRSSSTKEPHKTLSPVSSIVKKRSWLVPILSVLIILLVAAAIITMTLRQRDTTLLATVNGEPIYAADIEDTIRLLPLDMQTDENRAEFLEQTIDLLLLKQEAARRGIVVSDAEVETKISLIVNESGRSIPELRLLLADRNLTMDDYRKLVKDSLVVERLINQAIVNRITITEQEISSYYQANQAQFMPPRGGARISHILVEDENSAREIIAALNRGERFRDLAEENSIDFFSAMNGGEIGIVAPTDPYPAAFLRAALALLENQYTRVPVETEAGFHVILRNFDLPDIQEVRASIQQQLLAQKQQQAFTALIAGLRADATIRHYTEQGVVSAPQQRSLESFAACVGRTATLYGVEWSESFKEQEALFGSSASLLNIVNCDVYPAACNDAGVQKYPTWIIKGVQYGKLSLSELAQRTSCTLP